MWRSTGFLMALAIVAELATMGRVHRHHRRREAEEGNRLEDPRLLVMRRSP